MHKDLLKITFVLLRPRKLRPMGVVGLIIFVLLQYSKLNEQSSGKVKEGLSSVYST